MTSILYVFEASKAHSLAGLKRSKLARFNTIKNWLRSLKTHQLTAKKASARILLLQPSRFSPLLRLSKKVVLGFFGNFFPATHFRELFCHGVPECLEGLLHQKAFLPFESLPPNTSRTGPFRSGGTSSSPTSITGRESA